MPYARPAPSPARGATYAAALVAAFAAACGPAQDPGGFHGMPPAPVATTIVAARDIPVAYEYVGQTMGSKEVEVRARVGGILERKLFREGAAVAKGQRLFVIDPKPLQAQAAAAQAELARAQAQKAQADREAARLAPLAARRAIGQKEADDAASAAELAVANVRAAEARLREVELSLGYTTVVAPIAGLTSRAPRSEGSLVTANETLLTTISQVNPIWIPFAIPETERLALAKAVAAGRLALPKDDGYAVTIRLADGTEFPRPGRIDFADTRVNPATGSVEYRAEIPNADGTLKPGQFVRVRLAGAMRIGSVAIPQVAVQDGPQGKFVYVVDRDNEGKDVAGVRPVTLGEWVDAPDAKTPSLWIVERGLKPGERVIVDGVARLRPGAPIAADVPPPKGPPAAPQS